MWHETGPSLSHERRSDVYVSYVLYHGMVSANTILKWLQRRSKDPRWDPHSHNLPIVWEQYGNGAPVRSIFYSRKTRQIPLNLSKFPLRIYDLHYGHLWSEMIFLRKSLVLQSPGRRRPEKPTEVEGLKSLESLGEGEAQRSDKKPQEMGGSEGIDPPFIIKYISIGFSW